MRRIRTIAVFTVLACGWWAFQAANSQKAAPSCDRQCLEGFANQYLDAMVAHDGSKAPIARHVKFTENAKSLPIFGAREGLWITATARSNYRFFIADPQAEQVAFVGLIREGEKPALLSLRLKVENRQITEAR